MSIIIGLVGLVVTVLLGITIKLIKVKIRSSHKASIDETISIAIKKPNGEVIQNSINIKGESEVDIQVKN